MQEIESDFWFIALPQQWHSELDEDSILIFDEDELGCICLSNLQSETGRVEQADLESLIAELGHQLSDGKRCEIGEAWQGWEFDGEEGGDYVREWYLLAEDHLLLVTYSCAVEDRDMDRSAVDEILDSLRTKPA
ncbi:hypothetical protein [Spongiibacter sp.]|uniref:hypothetical protein n=1 Tax=Spongiibacter sp. TaxID=2024860 RepID=UPI003569D72A